MSGGGNFLQKISMKLGLLDLKASWWQCCCGELMASWVVMVISAHDHIQRMAELQLEPRDCHFRSLFCFETMILIPLFSLSLDTVVQECPWSPEFLSCHLKLIWKLILSNRSSLKCKSYSLSFSILMLNNYPNKTRKYFYLWKLLWHMFLNFILYSHTRSNVHTQILIYLSHCHKCRKWILRESS